MPFRSWKLLAVLSTSLWLGEGQDKELRSIPEVRCRGGSEVVLEIRKARVEVGGLGFDTRLYHLEGTPCFPGPTVVMEAGKTCKVNLFSV